MPSRVDRIPCPQIADRNLALSALTNESVPQSIRDGIAAAVRPLDSIQFALFSVCCICDKKSCWGIV
jgi:hypothetical protein